MSIVASSSTCMLYLLALAHSTSLSFACFLFLAALLLAILILISRSSNTLSRVSEENHLKHCPTQVPSDSPQESASMPSLFSPVKVLDETVPSPKQSTADLQTDTTAAKQPYDAFLVLDVEATCFRGTGFEWPNEIIVRPTSTRFPCRFLIIFATKGVASVSLTLER